MDTENVYRFVGLFNFVVGVGISIYYRSKANRQGGRVSTSAERKFVLYMRIVGGLFLWLSVLTYLINPGWLAWSSLGFPAWLRWTGAAVGFVSVGLIYWVFSSLGLNVTPTVVTRPDSQLVTRGPYRWVRHPLYTVGFLSFFGFFLLTGSWVILLGVLLTIPFLILRTPQEEEHLIQRFGNDYRTYMQRTGRFLPKLF